MPSTMAHCESTSPSSGTSEARVRLKPLADCDSEVLHRWINDRSTVVFNAPFRPVSKREHERWFASVGERADAVAFGIESIDSGRLVGSCQLVDIHPVHRIAELRIRIGEETARGRGLGTDALRLLIRFGFDDLNLHRIWLQVFSDNTRAVHVYEKLGFRIEGTLRQAAFVDGRFRDVYVMGLLRGDDHA